MRTALAVGLCLGLAFPASAEQTSGSSAIEKIVRGTTVCRDTKNDNAYCGADYWMMSVHENGYRVFTVASDQRAQNETRHATLWVDEMNRARESYAVSIVNGTLAGSSYVHLDGAMADVTVNDAGIPDTPPGIRHQVIESFEPENSLGTEPASADGLHFLDYDLEAGGPQPHSVYWYGGIDQGGMAGGFVTSEYEYLGAEDVELADGKIIPAYHFRMISGSEVWIGQEDYIMLRMELRFATVSGLVYETTELEVIPVGPGE